MCRCRSYTCAPARRGAVGPPWGCPFSPSIHMQVPKIFTAVFECTLQMITRNFEVRCLEGGGGRKGSKDDRGGAGRQTGSCCVPPLGPPCFTPLPTYQPAGRPVQGPRVLPACLLDTVSLSPPPCFPHLPSPRPSTQPPPHPPLGSPPPPPSTCLQDYPEHRLQFFSLLRAITNHCSATLFAMSPVRGRRDTAPPQWRVQPRGQSQGAAWEAQAPFGCAAGASCRHVRLARAGGAPTLWHAQLPAVFGAAFDRRAPCSP